MKERIRKIIAESISVKENLKSNHIDIIEKAADLIAQSIEQGGKAILFGNGGSAADAQHIAGELVGRFMKERPALAAIALTTNTSTLTAVANDYGYETTFARQIEGLGKKGDVAIGISTSGNSPNVIEGIKRAKHIGIRTVALTGGDGGKVSRIADLSVIVPSHSTPRIQESHSMIGHIICELVEEELFKNQARP